MFQYIQTFFSQPSKSYLGKNMKVWQSFVSFLILTILLVLPAMINLARSYQIFKPTFEDIQEKIPPFEIQDGQIQLEQETKSFVYEIDQSLFFFDPNGEMNRDIVKENLNKDTCILAGGFLKDELYFANPFQEINLPYHQISGLSDQSFNMGLIKQFMLIFILTSIFIAAIHLLISSLVTTLFVKVIAFISAYSYSFFDLWKIVLASSFLPAIFLIIARLFNLDNLFLLSLIQLLPILITIYSLSKDPERNTIV